MPSTYTTNNGIELIATGEQSGTWGATTNTNLELLDTALDGQVTVTLSSAGSSGSPNTLPVTDGAASNGRNRLVIFGDGGDLGGTAYVQLTPNNAEKIVYVRNNLSGSRSILLFQGTYSASNDYEIPAGKTAVVFFDGAGSGAVAANIFNNAHFDAMNIVGNVVVGGTVSATGTSVFASLDISGDIDVDGTTNLDAVDIDGAVDFASTTAHAGNATFADNAKAIFGAGSDLQIYHDGTSNHTFVKESGSGHLYVQADNLRLQSASGGNYAQGVNSDAFILYFNDSEKMRTTSTGIDVTGNATFADNGKAIFGAGSDLQIYHDGTDTQIDNNTGTLIVRSSAAGTIEFRDQGSQVLAQFNDNSDVKLYHNNNEKLATTSTGIEVSGNLNLMGGTNDTQYIKFGDTNDDDIGNIFYYHGNNNMVFTTNASEAMRINSSGNVGIGDTAPSEKLNVSGNIMLEGADQFLYLTNVGTGNNGIYVRGITADSTLRSHSTGIFTWEVTGSEKMRLTNGGDLQVTGTVTDDGATHDGDVTFTGASYNAVWDKSDSSLEFADNSKAKFGTGGDLQIFHDGTDSKIVNYTGDIIFQHAASDDITFKDAFGNLTANFKDGGAVTLYYNASQKFATTSGGIDVTGTITLDDTLNISDGTTTGFLQASGSALQLGATTNSYLSFFANNAEEMRLETDGDLHVDGNVIAYSTTISDERLKEDIKPIEGALDKVGQLNGYTFTYKADGKQSAGVIAQEVEAVLPSAVSESTLPLKTDDGVEYKTVQYDQLHGLLIEAIKELKAEIEELKNDSTK